jgi:hypothetical protein
VTLSYEGEIYKYGCSYSTTLNNNCLF